MGLMLLRPGGEERVRPCIDRNPHDDGRSHLTFPAIGLIFLPPTIAVNEEFRRPPGVAGAPGDVAVELFPPLPLALLS